MSSINAERTMKAHRRKANAERAAAIAGADLEAVAAVLAQFPEAEEIEPRTNLTDESFMSRIPKKEPARRKKLEEALASAKKALLEAVERYTLMKRCGAAALSYHDLCLLHNGDAAGALRSGLMLATAHISYNCSEIECYTRALHELDRAIVQQQG